MVVFPDRGGCQCDSFGLHGATDKKENYRSFEEFGESSTGISGTFVSKEHIL